jgi:hypothetical protein
MYQPDATAISYHHAKCLPECAHAGAVARAQRVPNDASDVVVHQRENPDVDAVHHVDIASLVHNAKICAR